MTREELRVYVDKQRGLNNIPYHVYSALIDGIDTLEQELCEDAIGRADMLDAVGHGTTYTSKEIQNIVNSLPPVTPQPKMGHWIDVFGGCECSECGCLEAGYSDYCPDCGAKMVDPQESEET